MSGGRVDLINKLLPPSRRWQVYDCSNRNALGKPLLNKRGEDLGIAQTGGSKRLAGWLGHFFRE